MFGTSNYSDLWHIIKSWFKRNLSSKHHFGTKSDDLVRCLAGLRPYKNDWKIQNVIVSNAVASLVVCTGEHYASVCDKIG